MNDEIIIGIDLGTTHSLVGVVDSGFPIVLANEKGERLLPSCVTWPVGRDPLVGTEAMRARALAPARTVASIKRFMGRTFADLSIEERSETPYRLVPGSRGEILVALDEKTLVSPEEVSAVILTRLKETAEAALEMPVSRAVVTVPAYFNHSQREATRRAAELAGLTVERILNEPTAAALAYGLDRLGESATVAVYDLGGGTFDLSVLQLREGFFEVIATAGDTRLGGDDLDLALARFLAGELDLGVLSEPEEATLRIRAREAKEALSTEERVVVRLPFFRGESSYEVEITRDRFEKLALPLIERTGPICRRAFAEAAEKGASAVEKLILVGGSTRIPLVRTKLKEWFGLEPDLSQHPDEAVALGAAIQAGMLCGRVRQILLVDVTPLSLGIETFGGLMNVIIPRNSTIPVKAGELFTNAVDGQASMAIRVLQGERELAKDNWLLGEVTVPFTPGPKSSARVGVQFAINRNGILEVLARDTTTGEDHVLEIRDAAVDVEDEAVERMISESIDYAFDDMNERVWTEAKFKSEELLPAVAGALELVGDRLEGDERSTITSAAKRVRELLEAETHDAAALKKANTALDEATQTLAALLVEAAFEG
ncbi:MAG: molecular chaperone DnaK [Verrucomicrobiia bacterium Tous-C2TDCM]|nr:MAG: molecular chaperone DnaK [Verrucomicrobiae bacterium Tous-C2TDCM]